MKSEIKLFGGEKVYLGEGRVGLATCWNKPKTVFGLDGIAKHVSILGSLYSAGGVEIMLANLALNPEIRTVVIWNHGELSNNSIGIVPVSIIRALTQHGIGDDGRVANLGYRLNPSLDPVVVREIVNGVQFIDAEKWDKSSMVQNLANVKADRNGYMDPVRFPEFEVTESRQVPRSERGHVVQAKNVGEAWAEMVFLIMSSAGVTDSQTGIAQRQMIGVSYAISPQPVADLSGFEDLPLDLKQRIGATRDAVNNYVPHITSPSVPENIAYTYGQRFGVPIDQIEGMVNQLRKAHSSRRAYASTWIPAVDVGAEDPPCLNGIQAILENGKLILIAHFRSQDIFRAMVLNSYGLLHLQEKIAKGIGVPRGDLVVWVGSAHIYADCFDDAAKLSACRKWERVPRLSLGDEQRDLVYFVFETEGNRIKMTVKNSETQGVIYEKLGSAAEHMATVEHLRFTRDSRHLMYLGEELSKATVAIQNGLQYVQDQQIDIKL